MENREKHSIRALNRLSMGLPLSKISVVNKMISNTPPLLK